MSLEGGADGPPEGEQEELEQGMDQSLLPEAAFDPALQQSPAMALAAAGRSALAFSSHTGGTRFGSGPVAALGLITSRVPVARKEEVQRLLGQCLVIKCDPAEPYLAPVVIMSTDETNIYSWLEKHLLPDYLVGCERFWKLVRADMSLDTWRPRVQGAQLKALNGARLPETTEELAQVENVVYSIQDCIRQDSNPDTMMHDLKLQIFNIQTWWENRNKRDSSSGKRPHMGGGGPATKRAASGNYADLQGPADALLGLGHQMPDFSALAANLVGGLGGGLMDMLPGYSSMDRKAWGVGVDGRPSGGGNLSGNSLVVLDVGGRRYTTSWNTLMAVPDSYFSLLVTAPEQARGFHKLPSGELFIDRCGELFGYVLDYLRYVYHSEPTVSLPNQAREVHALAREAAFYQLPGLVEACGKASIMPQPSTRAYFDSLYLETGYKSIEGAALKEMERCKVVVMQQMNHVLGLRAQEGFFVDNLEAGVQHRKDPEKGTTEHNLFYNILLKKVVPMLPRALQAAAANGTGGRSGEGGAAPAPAPQQQQQQQQQQRPPR